MANTYTLISSNVLGSSAASVTFSAIPSTYTDLVVRCSARGDGAGIAAYRLYLTFNSDTVFGGTQTSWTEVLGNGSSAASNSGSGQGFVRLWENESTATANTFGSAEIYIPNYAGATNKPVSGFSVAENNAAGGTNVAAINAVAGLRANTAAITAVNLYAYNNFVSGSSFYLYGISNS
jgi:hypothetical protein